MSAPDPVVTWQRNRETRNSPERSGLFFAYPLTSETCGGSAARDPPTKYPGPRAAVREPKTANRFDQANEPRTKNIDTRLHRSRAAVRDPIRAEREPG